MARWCVTEVVNYEVEAGSAEEACGIIEDDGDRDRFCTGVSEREAVRLPDEDGRRAET